MALTLLRDILAPKNRRGDRRYRDNDDHRRYNGRDDARRNDGRRNDGGRGRHKKNYFSDDDSEYNCISSSLLSLWNLLSCGGRLCCGRFCGGRRRYRDRRDHDRWDGSRRDGNRRDDRRDRVHRDRMRRLRNVVAFLFLCAGFGLLWMWAKGGRSERNENGNTVSEDKDASPKNRDAGPKDRDGVSDAGPRKRDADRERDHYDRFAALQESPLRQLQGALSPFRSPERSPQKNGERSPEKGDEHVGLKRSAGLAGSLWQVPYNRDRHGDGDGSHHGNNRRGKSSKKKKELDPSKVSQRAGNLRGSARHSRRESVSGKGKKRKSKGKESTIKLKLGKQKSSISSLSTSKDPSSSTKPTSATSKKNTPSKKTPNATPSKKAPSPDMFKTPKPGMRKRTTNKKSRKKNRSKTSRHENNKSENSKTEKGYVIEKKISQILESPFVDRINSEITLGFSKKKIKDAYRTPGTGTGTGTGGKDTFELSPSPVPSSDSENDIPGGRFVIDSSSTSSEDAGEIKDDKTESEFFPFIAWGSVRSPNFAEKERRADDFEDYKNTESNNFGDEGMEGEGIQKIRGLVYDPMSKVAKRDRIVNLAKGGLKQHQHSLTVNKQQASPARAQEEIQQKLGDFNHVVEEANKQFKEKGIVRTVGKYMEADKANAEGTDNVKSLSEMLAMGAGVDNEKLTGLL